METPFTKLNSHSRDVSDEERAELLALEAKIHALLPPKYQHCLDLVKPVSMGSAELLYGADGKIQWDQIWTSFCDLALAGGPPHRGRFLEPTPESEVLAYPDLYQKVVEEIARGIWMVTELPVLPHMAPGWVVVRCPSIAMAAWLVRAIMVENVSAHHEHHFLYLPAGPHFRPGKEIKNVVTTMAKTYHYWTFHMSPSRWIEEPDSAVDSNLAATELLDPALPCEALAAPSEYASVVAELEQGIHQVTALKMVSSSYLGWVGIQCASVEMAVWLMRAIIVDKIIVRREEDLLFIPANAKFASGEKTGKIIRAIAHACHLWEIHIALAS